MLFKGAMSGMEGSEGSSTSHGPSLLDRELPPTPNPALAVPSLSDFQGNYVPPWMRSTASTASTTRQSRASSIVSTLTRFTTASIDDARSIDIHVGGQNFRIARDASKITSEAPPPYTADEAITRSHILEEVRPRTAPIHTLPSDTDSEGPTRLPAITTLGANILNPSEVDIPSPTGDDETTPPSTPRSSTRPSQRNDSPSAHHHRSGSSNGADFQETLTRSLTVRPYKSSRPRERADLPLLSTTSNELEMQGICPRSTQFKAWQTMSVEDLLLAHPEEQSQEPHSPDYIGQHADGIFPLRTATQIRLRSDSGYIGEEDHLQEGSGRTPNMDNENDISLHYARMIRFVDKQHRRALHLRDKEMEELRIRMSNMDTVYRQQLRGRDFIIEDLKRRLRHAEDLMEAKIEAACNSVEDLWEKRWKDRDFHLRERMSRIESQAGLDLYRSRKNLAEQEEET
jgi:hypothetical protein